MALYAWCISLTANYGAGLVVVEASDIDKARQLALSAFSPEDRERHACSYMEWQDQEDRDNIAERFEIYKREIMAEPYHVGDVLFVSGSE